MDVNDPNVTPPCDNDPVDVILCLYSCFLGNFSREERKCITEIVENELDVGLSQHDVSMTYQDGESLAVVDEQDFNVTPAGDDDVLKVILVQYSCFTTNWTGRRRSSCRGGCKRS